MNNEQTYIQLYDSHRDSLFASAPQPMNAVRDRAMQTFQQQGFPSRKVEDYRYIDVAQAFAGDYAFAVPQTQISVGDAQVAVNNVELLNQHYSTIADNADPLTALNTALAAECLCIHVLKNQKVARPLELTDSLRASEPTMEHKRMLIVLEEGAELTMLMHYVAPDRCRLLATQVVEVYVADGAHLDMYELEETHTSCTRFNNIYFHIGANATVRHNAVTLFNGLTRNTLHARLCGQGSDVTFNGCVMASKSQTVDTNTLIRHEVPGCTSHELYKYVVDEHATGAFAGKVYVAEGADGTLSDEVNQNICASDDARMYTQPMLEIYADDVKCSHGSTVGKLDDAALFYLRQRGIPLAEARMLLMQAFVGQVIDYIPLPALRDRLHLLVERRLRGGLDKCTGCAMCQSPTEK